MSHLTIVGRSSSHYTRVTRMFAMELGVAYAFRPVLDIMALDPAVFADNPALKVPILVDEHGSLFGTENICREIARRSGRSTAVVLRGDVPDRLVANAEELVLHAMSSGVSIIMAKMGGGAVPPKLARSLENTLRWLDENVEALATALPRDRALSFVEVALFSCFTHLTFRDVADVTPWKRLTAFSDRFGHRESARETTYRFDT